MILTGGLLVVVSATLDTMFKAHVGRTPVVPAFYSYVNLVTIVDTDIVCG